MTSPRRIVVVGAARSGTKLLRDALAVAVGAGAVPYDIGFVWRAGLAGHPDDRLPPEALVPRRARWIRGVVDRYAAGEPRIVVEKSVGTVMRVPYVARVLPEALFVHLVRDGTDVVESTYRQWTSPSDVRYLARKARHVPWRVLPAYGARYLRSTARRWVAHDRRVGTWGPRYPGIDADLRSEPLLTVCARQWRQGVTLAREDLDRLDVTSVEVRYEDLVRKPDKVLREVAAAGGFALDADALTAALSDVSTARIGHGLSALSAESLSLVDAEIGPLLGELGYSRPQASVGGAP